MLRISSRGRYGVKAVFELAVQYGNGPVAVQAIAKSQGIPEPYLEQLMPPLKRAGLVSGTRGAQGGYALAKNPDRISVGDVVRALEGPIAIADCTSDDPASCPELVRCVGPDVWVQVQNALVATMDSITFEQLLPRKRMPQRIEAMVEEGGG